MKTPKRRTCSLVCAPITIFCVASFQSHLVFADPFQKGDVFASVSDGLIQHYDANGTLLETLDTGKGGGFTTTGCAFDSAGNLYVTTFNAGDVVKYRGPEDPHTLDTFGSGYNGSPESIIFDAVGNAYVGAVRGDDDIRKFDAEGKFLAQFDVITERLGSDWIDLAADQRTIFYTSEGQRILRYDVVGNTQLPDFTSSLPGSEAFALRILPDDSVLVADSELIVRLDNTASVIKTYDVPGENTWFSLNLDPDGTSFWAGSTETGKFYKFDIATGGAPLLIVDTGVGPDRLFGVCVFEEITTGTKDSDGDGLPDDWEINGVDTTGDGDRDLKLNSLEEIGENTPPRLDHKDVYVWVDWLEGADGHSHKPDEEALLLVKKAFAEAPVAHLNPDGKRGINLHIILGRAITESDALLELGHQDRFIYFSSEFANVKRQYLQGDGTRPGMAGVFHYAVYAHYLPAVRRLCPVPTAFRPGGIAPLIGFSGFGSDFIIGHQSWRERENEGGLTPLVQGGAFMHELGHTLNLRHGGVGISDVSNRKPNHLSVMNYAFAKGLLFKRDGERIPKPSLLDYSRFGPDTMPTLNEDRGLMEEGGLQGGLAIEKYGTIYFFGKFDEIGVFVADANGDIDWNFNNSIDTTPVRANINGDTTFPLCTERFTSLSTSNEWEGLSYQQGDIGKVAALIPEYPPESGVEEPDIPPGEILKIVSVPSVLIGIDIKPSSSRNPINLKSKGVIPVAILTTDSFDATGVEPLSVKFGPNSATEAHGRGHVEDVDGDGDTDLVLHFRTQETGIQCGDTSASLTGETFDGQAIEGSDSIKTVGCKK